MNKQLWLVCASAVAFTACGGSNGGRGDDNASGGSSSSAVVGGVDYSKLAPTPQTSAPLALASGEVLAEHLKNGMRLKVRSSDLNIDASGGFQEELALPANAAPDAPTDAASDAAGGNSDGGFSETNVHVAGVDEADYVKYDGSHWFIATYPEYERYQINSAPGIRIVATNPAAATAEAVAQIDMDSDWYGVNEMYLVAEQGKTGKVAAIQNRWGNVYPVMPGIGFPEFGVGIGDVMPMPAIEPFFGDAYYGYPVNSQVKVQLFDVAQASSPEQAGDITIDGSLIDSRKIDNTLYLVTRFDPWVVGLVNEYSGDAVRESNEAILDDIALTQLLPTYSIDGADAQPLTQECYWQDGTAATHGMASLVHVTAVDLVSKQVVASTCINSSIEALSMSEDALYLTATQWADNYYERESTVVHKFAVEPDAITYRATGAVKGYIGHRADPAFKLHEQGDDLRVVTSTGNTWDNSIKHHLWVLEDNGNGELTAVAGIPNEVRPEAIGKPGEDIYSVRFDGDKAYIVTFQQTDPLYSIDLSDRLDPKITGELEIPGFATYMHPLNDNYVFAIGQDADSNGRVTGMKVALMDVSGDSPKEIKNITIGSSGTRSEALSNLKALTVRKVDDDKYHFGLPIDYYAVTASNSWGQWQHTGLHLFEVAGLTGASATLTSNGVVIAEQASDTKRYPQGGGHDRGILHGDAVYFAHANAVYAANWNSPEDVSGPINSIPVNCDAYVAPSLEVNVTAPGGNACDATVKAFLTDYEQQAEYTLQASGSGETCTFTGPDEIAGPFTVGASMPGFSLEGEKTTVYKDACHVQTKTLDINLKPLSVSCPAIPLPPSVSVFIFDDGYDTCGAYTATVVQGGIEYELEGYSTQVKEDNVMTIIAQGCHFSGANGVSGLVDIVVTQDGSDSQVAEAVLIEQRDACSVVPVERHFYF